MTKLTFCGGVGEVTGANFLLETEHKKILIDCGMAQGSVDMRAKNYEAFPYNPSEIDILFVTHAHIDHIGRIPKLVKDGFKGVIYSTPYTREIAPFMLADSSRLLQMEAEQKNIEILYNMDHVEQALSLWETIPYHKKKEIDDEVSVYIKNAGHILGSGIVEITSNGQKGPITTAFTGDLGNTPTPLLPETEYVSEADYMVIESVYGDRNHPPVSERRGKFLEALKEAINRGGTILIPMFSLEKTQVILHELNYFVENKLIPQVPVFLDSPLAIKVTGVYAKAVKEFNSEAQKEIAGGDNIFDFPGLTLVGSADESKNALYSKNPKILIAGSGMSSGGRIVDHEKLLLPDSRNTIIFLGYQGAGTLGRQIVDGLKKVMIYKEEIKVSAKVIEVLGYSSHKDSEHLLDFVAHTAPRMKKVFVAMGETRSALFLAQRIKDYLNISAVHPQENETVELI